MFDPTNYGQNLLTAARTLQNINNQIMQLQNEANMIRNQVKNLSKLDSNSRFELNRRLRAISSLMVHADAMSFEIQEADRMFREQYPQDYAAMSNQQVTQNAIDNWNTSRAALNDSLKMQSHIVEAVEADTTTLDTMMTESQGAEGNLAATQAGNQIMALSAKQTMQLQEPTASQYRAETLERARILQIEQAGKERHKRFVGTSSAYPGN